MSSVPLACALYVCTGVFINKVHAANQVLSVQRESQTEGIRVTPDMDPANTAASTHRSEMAVTKKVSTQLQAEMSTVLLANPRSQGRNQSKDEQTNKAEAFCLTSTNTFSV